MGKFSQLCFSSVSSLTVKLIILFSQSSISRVSNVVVDHFQYFVI